MPPHEASAEPLWPNIVVILADDLGYADLSCYGAKDMRTPHIDALVGAGMKFDNFYANCSVCSPTRAALLTGRYPAMVGVPGVIRTHADQNFGYLAPDATLLPKLLKPSGYQCAIVGKWHLGLESPNTPNERGFDLFHGWLADMMDDYYKHRRHDINYMRLNGDTIDPPGHATDLFTEWASEFIGTQNEQHPFFLYLAYNAPHAPIQPPDGWLAKVRQREPGISEKRAKLVALIEHMDDGVGRVMKTLKDTGRDKNTIIVFTSDNGGPLAYAASNGDLRDGKGSMYEGGLKVPAAVVWPPHIAAGKTTSQMATTMDLFPTLLDVAGVWTPSGIDGVSFAGTLIGRNQPPLRTDWLFTRREGGPQFDGKSIDAVRRGDWKLLQNSPFGPLELYNLKTDPREQHNVIKQEPKVYKELSAALQQQTQRTGSVPWQRSANGK